MLMVDKAEKVAKADKDVEVLFAISSAHSGWPPIMLRAKLENSFQVNAIENVKVFFVDVGLQPLTELIEGNSSQPIFVDEVCIKDGDLEKIEELAKNQSMCLWIAQTGLETSMEGKWTSWLSNQSAFHIPQLSYCMRNSKSIFHESEKASQVYSSFRHSSTSDRVQLPVNVAEGNVRIIEQERDDDLKCTLAKAFDSHPAGPVIIVHDEVILFDYTAELFNDIEDAVADIRKCRYDPSIEKAEVDEGDCGTEVLSQIPNQSIGSESQKNDEPSKVFGAEHREKDFLKVNKTRGGQTVVNIRIKHRP